MHRRTLVAAGLATPALLALHRPARAADRVRVAVFDVASALPFYVARERGHFAAQGVEVAHVPLNAGPLIVQAMVTGDVDAASNLVTLEGANINARRANTAIYFALNGQNERYRMEQFLVRPASTARTIADLRGARILSAPGPANMSAARAILASVGLQDGRDYTLTEQPMGVHVCALAAGTFDAAYTLEPQGTLAERAGAGRRLEAGSIATHLLGRPDAEAYAAGACFTGRFLTEQPDVARRYAAAWSAAIAGIRDDPTTRALLTQFMNTPAELAGAIPMLDFSMVRDLNPQQLADFQKFVDLAVAQGVVRDPIQVSSFIRAL